MKENEKKEEDEGDSSSNKNKKGSLHINNQSIKLAYTQDGRDKQMQKKWATRRRRTNQKKNKKKNC